MSHLERNHKGHVYLNYKHTRLSLSSHNYPPPKCLGGGSGGERLQLGIMVDYLLSLVDAVCVWGGVQRLHNTGRVRHY